MRSHRNRRKSPSSCNWPSECDQEISFQYNALHSVQSVFCEQQVRNSLTPQITCETHVAMTTLPTLRPQEIPLDVPASCEIFLPIEARSVDLQSRTPGFKAVLVEILPEK